MPDPVLLLRGAPGRAWHTSGRARATGWGSTPDGRVLVGPALAAYLDGPAAAFAERAAALGGAFAAVRTDGATAEIVVDRVRSIPLVYGPTAGGGWLVSDDARRAARALDARVDQPLEAAEFLLKTAVGGPDTLSSALHAVQAAERIVLRPGAPAESARYAVYGAGPRLDADDETLLRLGADALETAFDRMLESVRGRPLVVPLSGGLDSRLVAAMLAAGGRTDTLCVSYGRRGNAEARTAQRVAQALGLRWTFVPYSAARWHAWAQRPDYARFRCHATSLVSIEHEQDWPAVHELRRQGLPDDAVFVPGHTGDFLASGHVHDTPEADAVGWIWRHAYREWPTSGLSDETRAALQARIAARVAGAETPVHAFVQDVWQERQAKMIANAVRVYEHHGVGWRMPLWSEPAVLDVWGRMPMHARRGKRLWRRAVQRLAGDAVGAIPTVAPRAPLADRWARLTDRDAGRYGIWLGRRPLARATHTRLRDLVRIADPAIRAVADAIVAPWAHLPPQRAGLNALLALHQLNDLADGDPLREP